MTVMREPSSDDSQLDQKGPGIGERFPDITLPDQTGAPIRLQQARGDRRALVVFYRSARW
jgi:peroxiredoxin